MAAYIFWLLVHPKFDLWVCVLGLFGIIDVGHFQIYSIWFICLIFSFHFFHRHKSSFPIHSFLSISSNSSTYSHYFISSTSYISSISSITSKIISDNQLQSLSLKSHHIQFSHLISIYLYAHNYFSTDNFSLGL